jgi:hypothetical protein
VLNRWLDSQNNSFKIDIESFLPFEQAAIKFNDFEMPSNQIKDLSLEDIDVNYYDNMPETKINDTIINTTLDTTYSSTMYYDEHIASIAKYIYPKQENMQKGLRGYLHQLFPLNPDCNFNREKVSSQEINDFINNCPIQQKNLIDKLYEPNFLKSFSNYKSVKLYAYLYDLCILYPEIIEFITSVITSVITSEYGNSKHINTTYILRNMLLKTNNIIQEVDSLNTLIKELHKTIISIYPLWKNKNSYEKPYYNKFIIDYNFKNSKIENLEIIFKKLIEIINQSQFKHISSLNIFVL